MLSVEEAIKKAEQTLIDLSSDEETMRIYYEREKSLHERANMITSAEERKAVEIAKNLLNMNITVQQIALATGLNDEEINKLR